MYVPGQTSKDERPVAYLCQYSPACTKALLEPPEEGHTSTLVCVSKLLVVSCTSVSRPDKCLCGRICVLFVCLVGACLFHCFFLCLFRNVLVSLVLSALGQNQKKNRQHTLGSDNPLWSLFPSSDCLKWTGAATGHILPVRWDPPGLAALKETRTSLCRQSGGPPRCKVGPGKKAAAK